MGEEVGKKKKERREEKRKTKGMGTFSAGRADEFEESTLYSNITTRCLQCLQHAGSEAF